MYRIYVILIFLLSSGYSNAQLQTRIVLPGDDNRQYFVVNWTTEEGLPSNTIQSIMKSEEGYIWLTSYDGLIKFDGIEFTVYNKSRSSKIATNGMSLAVNDANGKLWVGTYGSGVISMDKGEIKNNYEGLPSNLSIQTLFIDHSNTLWVGTRGKGLYYKVDDVFKEFQQSSITKDITISAIAQSGDGSYWFGTEGNGLIKFKGNESFAYTIENGLSQNNIFSIYFDHNNTMWVGTNQGLNKFNGHSFEKVEVGENCLINKIFEGPSNNLWVATNCGIFIKYAMSENWVKLPIENVLADNYITDAFFDNKEGLWLSTYRAGVFQFKPSKFLNYTILEGLSTKAISSISISKNGDILVGTNNGIVNTIIDGQVGTMTFKTKMPETRIKAILEDKNKNLWIGTSAGMLIKYRDGSEKWFTTENGLPHNEVRVFYEDKLGFIWFGTRAGGLVKVMGDGSFNVLNKTNLLNSNFIMSINQNVEGDMLIGTNEGGLNILKKDGSVEYLSTKDGLASDMVFCAFQDNDEVYWIGTNSGLTRIEGDKFFNFSTTNGLPTDAPFDILEDKYGFFWITTSKGIAKVNKSQLNAFAYNSIDKVDFRFYDKQDGLKESECTGAAKSLMTQSGSIWVPTLNGVVVIDPDNIQLNLTAPPVFIKGINVDNQALEYKIGNEITLPSGTKRIMFNYEALNFTAPLKTKYKYKLENFDREWVYSNNNREAIYTNLHYGDYVFKVIACNEDGVWNNDGASVKFSISPQIYETYPFYILSSIVAILLIWGVIRWRVYSVKERNMALAILVKEQTKELRDINAALEEQKEEIESKNEELAQQNEEILSQRDALSNKNEQLEDAKRNVLSANNELRIVNTSLEEKVHERTKDLRQTLDKLVKSNEELDTFIYRASHDLKGPTASLLGLAFLGQYFGKEQHSLDVFQKFVVIINNMNKILKKLTTRHFISKTPVSYIAIDITKLIDEISKSLKLLDNYNEVSLIVDYDPALVWYSDEMHLKVILENLLENAYVFQSPKLKEPQSVWLSIEKHLDNIKITIRDNGSGIEDQYKKRIFDLFFRGSQRSKGNGLGLYLVKNAIYKLQGNIEMKSEYGKYSMFTVYLPSKEFIS